MTVNRRSRAVLTHLLAVLPQLPALIVEERKETFCVGVAQRDAPLGEEGLCIEPPQDFLGKQSGALSGDALMDDLHRACHGKRLRHFHGSGLQLLDRGMPAVDQHVCQRCDKTGVDHGGLERTGIDLEVNAGFGDTVSRQLVEHVAGELRRHYLGEGNELVALGDGQL